MVPEGRIMAQWGDGRGRGDVAHRRGHRRDPPPSVTAVAHRRG